MSTLELSSSPANAEPPATRPAYEGSRVIQSDSLVVELMDPSDPDRYYTGVRFTPMAAVIRAVFNGTECLFHAAKHDPAKDVAGLFAEFDLVTPPPGFDNSAIGDPFLKIGVGALVKTTEKYQFYNPYPTVNAANTKTEWSADTAHSVQTFSGVEYGYELRVTTSVVKNELDILWKLDNTGRKTIRTQHYAHNSFRFGERTIGSGYSLSFPFDFKAAGLKPEQLQLGRAIVFGSALEKPVNIGIAYPEQYDGINSLNLTDEESGISVHCETSLPGARVAVHAAPQYVCPEQFIEVVVEPGQSKEWRRKYIFNKSSRASQH